MFKKICARRRRCAFPKTSEADSALSVIVFMEPAPVKVCKKFGEPKPTATEFYRQTKGSRGREGRFRPICKDCWNGREPEVTDEERGEFTKRFVLEHLKQHGESCHEFFRHAIPYKYREITKPAVDSAIKDLVNRGLIRVTRSEKFGEYARTNFLALAYAALELYAGIRSPSELLASLHKAREEAAQPDQAPTIFGTNAHVSNQCHGKTGSGNLDGRDRVPERALKREREERWRNATQPRNSPSGY
jgi:hypothetical protein